MYDETGDGLYPGYSASGQDVWIEEAHYNEPGIVVSAVGARCGKAFKADGKWTAIANTHVLLPRKNFDRDYLWWVFNDEAFWNKGGSAQPYVQFESSLDREICVPKNIDHQQAIADYLDRETAKIDGMIVAKERLLELLAEKRQALITHAVTRGLNPNAPLRDSGIPWLGKIPVHWVATRLKFIAEVRGGLTIGKNYGRSEVSEYFYLRVANVQDGVLDLSDISTVYVPESEAISCLLKYGDVLMNEGGDSDKLGRGCVWRDEISPCLHQNHVFAVRPNNVRSEWLNAWTSSEVAKSYFESRSKQSTNLASISATNIKELPVLLPSETEQCSIVAFIERETAKLDALKQVAERTISLLKERRSAFIAAAVVGKIDIPLNTVL